MEWEVWKWVGEKNVLILGSFPLPFLERFCRRLVEEKGAVVLRTIACCGQDGRVLVCQLGVGRAMDATWYGRKTGRKAERFISCVLCVLCKWRGGTF